MTKFSRCARRVSNCVAAAAQAPRTLQACLRHRNIQHTVRYTELSPTRFRTSGATDADCPISAKKVVGTRAEGLQDSLWTAVLTWRRRKSTSVRSTSAKLAPPS